jgi:hypothetical protein
MCVGPVSGAETPIYTVCDVMKAPGKLSGSTIRIRARFVVDVLRQRSELLDDRCKSAVLHLETPIVVMDRSIEAFESKLSAAAPNGIDSPIDVVGVLVWKSTGASYDAVLVVAHVWSLAGIPFTEAP